MRSERQLGRAGERIYFGRVPASFLPQAFIFHTHTSSTRNDCSPGRLFFQRRVNLPERGLAESQLYVCVLQFCERIIRSLQRAALGSPRARLFRTGEASGRVQSGKTVAAGRWGSGIQEKIEIRGLRDADQVQSSGVPIKYAQEHTSPRQIAGGFG